MKKIIPLLSVFLVLFSCSNDSALTISEERQILDELKLEIESLATSVPCTENSECDFVGFGSKPCGGYWGYIAYNTAIDTSTFLQKVKQHNEMEEKHNKKWGLFSDCSLPPMPTTATCIDGKCTAIY